MPQERATCRIPRELHRRPVEIASGANVERQKLRCYKGFMKNPHSLVDLTDEQLLLAVKRLARGERHAAAQLIASLAELDARELYLAEGFPSLFAYCTRCLHLSEHAVYGRIAAARAARQWPGDPRPAGRGFYDADDGLSAGDTSNGGQPSVAARGREAPNEAGSGSAGGRTAAAPAGAVDDSQGAGVKSGRAAAGRRARADAAHRRSGDHGLGAARTRRTLWPLSRRAVLLSSFRSPPRSTRCK